MITASTNVKNEIISPVRDIRAGVELYEGSTLVETCYCNDRLISFNIERIGDESRFFGFGICQRLNVHLIDKDRELTVSTANSMRVFYAVGEEKIYPYPTFYVSEVRRDENTNELSITSYDTMYPDTAHLVKNLTLAKPYTVLEFARAAAAELGATGVVVKGVGADETCFSTVYADGANFEGTELVREALNDVAEVTQTIFYIDRDNRLVFKRLDKDGAADLTIRKADYISLKSRTNRRLVKLVHATELGDNLSVDTGVSGTTQYIRDNAFWELRDDVNTLLTKALAVVGNLCINQFECTWRGNFLLEIGDKISLVTKDNSSVSSYVLDDTIDYTGYLNEKTNWSYNANDTETEETPTTLGDALNQTFAKVDKVNKQIQLVASDVNGFDDRISAIELNTDQISATVTQVKKDTDASIGGLYQEVDTLTKRVQGTVTADNVSILIQKELASGVNSVKTHTGFTFDEEGLTIDKSGSEMSTTITEDGMTVYRSGTAMLKANNVGVEATNLHATTYLIIGLNSRFEDYANKTRTGCFWIGN